MNVPDHYFTTSGVCRFSPPVTRTGSTTRRDGTSTEWWMIVECGRDIGAYLRSLYCEYHHRVSILNEPLWGTHVSIIRNEKPKQMGNWKSLEGQPITIRYSNQVEIHEAYAAVSAECDALLDYRMSLGLPREPEIPMHMTIGNLK